MLAVVATAPPNPRMQPTGRTGAELCAGGTLLERSKERRFVRARARGLQLMLIFVRPTPPSTRYLEKKALGLCMSSA